jgi:hypothetical protein
MALGLGCLTGAFGLYAGANAEVVINRKQPLDWEMPVKQD